MAGRHTEPGRGDGRPLAERSVSVYFTLLVVVFITCLITANIIAIDVLLVVGYVGWATRPSWSPPPPAGREADRLPA